MICANCGTYVEDGKTNCPSCGAPAMAGGEMSQPGMDMGQNVNEPVNMGGFQSGYSEPGLSKKEFYKHPNLSQVSKQIKGCGIAMYILAVLNVGIFAVMGDIFSAVFSLVLMLGLGLGIHLAQSRVCAILLTIYGVFNTVISVITTGKFSGWLFLLVGIYGIIYTFKFQKAWKQYKTTGIVPFVAAK